MFLYESLSVKTSLKLANFMAKLSSLSEIDETNIFMKKNMII